MIYSWKKIVKHGLPLLTIAVLIEVFAGQILQGNINKLVDFSILLISIPVINSVSGNIGSVLGARLASGLHVGYITKGFQDKFWRENLLTSIFIGVLTYFLLAIIIYYMAIFGGSEVSFDLIEFIAIIIFTGLLLVWVVSLIGVITAFYSFKRGLDPDDMVAPVVTTSGDVMGILFLFMVIGIFGV